jgi:hypothetical protein
LPLFPVSNTVTPGQVASQVVEGNPNTLMLLAVSSLNQACKLAYMWGQKASTFSSYWLSPGILNIFFENPTCMCHKESKILIIKSPKTSSLQVHILISTVLLKIPYDKSYGFEIIGILLPFLWKQQHFYHFYESRI